MRIYNFYPHLVETTAAEKIKVSDSFTNILIPGTVLYQRSFFL